MAYVIIDDPIGGCSSTVRCGFLNTANNVYSTVLQIQQHRDLVLLLVVIVTHQQVVWQIYLVDVLTNL
jgi:hypothetical protein